MKEHRITQNGNSSSVTLAQDELDHLGAERGDIVIIRKMGNQKLHIQVRHPDTIVTRRMKQTRRH